MRSLLKPASHGAAGAADEPGRRSFRQASLAVDVVGTVKVGAVIPDQYECAASRQNAFISAQWGVSMIKGGS